MVAAKACDIKGFEDLSLNLGMDRGVYVKFVR